MDDNTRFEILIGLHVTDEIGYEHYRAGMTPILESFGGYFRYDLRVSEMLKGEADDPLNRVFVISFPDENAKDRFFDDEEYKVIRAKLYESAVKSGGVIASYTTE